MARKQLTGAPKEDLGIVFGSNKVCITFPSDTTSVHLVAGDVLKKHRRPESVAEELGYHALMLDAAVFACPENHVWLNELMHAIATGAPAKAHMVSTLNLVDGFANMEVANEIMCENFKEDWDASQHVIDAYAGTGALTHRVYAFGENQDWQHPQYEGICVYYKMLMREMKDVVLSPHGPNPSKGLLRSKLPPTMFMKKNHRHKC